MIPVVLKAIVVFAGCMIIIHIEPALNQMSLGTPFLKRLAFQLLALGASAEVVCVIDGNVPDWSSTIVTVGIAVLLLCERRQKLSRPLAMKELQ